MVDNIENAKRLAAQLAAWDSRITQIAILEGTSEPIDKFDLLFSFEPEPDCDTTGYFWIANLLTRIDFERFDEKLAIPFVYDLGFKIGEQVFLPNGEVLREPKDYTVLWPEDEER